MAHPTEQQPVIICGAGISGLAFAQGLRKHGIPFDVYERDSGLLVRPQGYRVRLHGDSILALQDNLSPEHFKRLEECAAITGEGGTHLNAVTCEESVGRKPPGPPPGVKQIHLPINMDRSVLRQVLSQGIETHVHFGKEFAHYEESANGIKVFFKDGTSVEGALLVAADGAYSKIRRQFGLGLKLVDTEARLLYGKSKWTPELERTLHRGLQEGISMVQDQSTGIPISLLTDPIRFKDNEFRKDLPHDYVYWVLFSRKDNFDMPEHELEEVKGDQAVELTLKLTSKWHPSIRVLFEQQDKGQTSLLRITSSKPKLPVWETNDRVTFLGDSIHVMAPTGGSGAVTALRDAGNLSNILSRDGFGKASIQKYETIMREYANETVERSAAPGKHMYAMRDWEELPTINL